MHSITGRSCTPTVPERWPLFYRSAYIDFKTRPLDPFASTENIPGHVRHYKTLDVKDNSV
jgi:hypothetical protein